MKKQNLQRAAACVFLSLAALSLSSCAAKPIASWIREARSQMEKETEEETHGQTTSEPAAEGTGSARETEATAESTEGAPDSETPEETTESEPETEAEADRPDTEVYADGKDFLLKEMSFHQGGNYSVGFSVYGTAGDTGDVRTSEGIRLTFYAPDPSGTKSTYDPEPKQYFYAELSLQPEETRYSVALQKYGSRTVEAAGTLELSMDLSSGTVRISGGIFDGIYYPESSFGEAAKLAERYYSKAELAFRPSDELRLLRNSIYALHGRKFNSEDLQSFFGKQPWYIPAVEPEQFDDSCLTAMERANTALISSLEAEEPAARTANSYVGPSGLDAAPYLPHLDIFEETGIRVDMSRARNMGAYWEVPGTVYQPVTMTVSQWEDAKNGGEVSLTANELTGETLLAACTDTGSWILYPEEHRSLTDQEKTYQGDEAGIAYDFRNGVYQFWQDSADTVMKPVWQGDIRLAKGAVHGAHVSLDAASIDQKEIVDTDTEIYGNRVYHDESGTILALYYLGD